MRFYAEGRKERDFENGIEAALEAILASPQFVCPRSESSPAAACDTARAAAPPGYRLNDLELRVAPLVLPLGHAPDDELIAVAARAGCPRPACSTKQVRRMLADPRADALVDALRGAVAPPAGPRAR